MTQERLVLCYSSKMLPKNGPPCTSDAVALATGSQYPPPAEARTEIGDNGGDDDDRSAGSEDQGDSAIEKDLTTAEMVPQEKDTEEARKREEDAAKWSRHMVRCGAAELLVALRLADVL